MDITLVTTQLKQFAGELGFAASGACPAVTPAGIHRFREWLEAGYAGQMRYLVDRAGAYRHPRHVMEGVRSLLMLALPYQTVPPRPSGEGHGRVSRYAWSATDYHDVIHSKLTQLKARAAELIAGVRVRGVVDTAPLLEREFAQLAGLGWIGKNTLLLSRETGSWMFLAALLLDCELSYDAPFEADHCGTCTACLDACPTGAFPRPHVLDATRCISYLTIELRGPVPAELRSQMDDWLFGCDVCQDVCPWNDKAMLGDNALFGPLTTMNPAELLALFELDDQSFRDQFRHTPLWRARRRGLLRNAAIVLGNRPVPAARSALFRGLQDGESLVRGASAWALGQFRDQESRTQLRLQLGRESHPDVRAEIERALTGGETR